MPLIWLFALLPALALAGYGLGRHRAVTSAGGDVRNPVVTLLALAGRALA